MKKIAKGKHKKAAGQSSDTLRGPATTRPRRDLSRADRARRFHEKIAKSNGGDGVTVKPPKTSLFLRPETKAKAKKKAAKLGMSLTAYIARLVDDDVKKAA